MCRILAIRNFNCREHRDLLMSFSRLAEKGKVPPGSLPGHNDGWGFGYFRSGRAVLHKSASSILQEKSVFRRLVRDSDGSPSIIVHLRKSAWPHTSTASNAHPFLYDNFLFAHNGTIRDYQALAPYLSIERKHSRIKRALDSEIFFYFILSNMGLGVEKALKRAAGFISGNNSFSSLNCVLASEKGLFAYRQYSLNPSYYSLYHAVAGKSDIICSEPVDGSLPWKMLRRGFLLAL